MKSEGRVKQFDCVKWTREVRDRIYGETRDMTREERRQWSEARIRTDPVLARLHDRRRAPKAGRPSIHGGGPTRARLGISRRS